MIYNENNENFDFFYAPQVQIRKRRKVLRRPINIETTHLGVATPVWEPLCYVINAICYVLGRLRRECYLPALKIRYLFNVAKLIVIKIHKYLE